MRLARYFSRSISFMFFVYLFKTSIPGHYFSLWAFLKSLGRARGRYSVWERFKRGRYPVWDVTFWACPLELKPLRIEGWSFQSNCRPLTKLLFFLHLNFYKTEQKKNERKSKNLRFSLNCYVKFCRSSKSSIYLLFKDSLD